jgi:proteasome lid subunit RPN8/RPN11
MQDLNRRRTLQALSVALTLGIAGTASAQPKKGSFRLEIPPYKNGDELLTWLAYGKAVAAWATTSKLIDSEFVGLVVPTFDGEFYARRSSVQVWKELKELKKREPSFPYIEKMLEVERAGFLREYVWVFHFHPSWDPMPSDLKIDEFERWRTENLYLHEAKTGSRVIIDR